jgi:hypothetical protein
VTGRAGGQTAPRPPPPAPRSRGRVPGVNRTNCPDRPADPAGAAGWPEVSPPASGGGRTLLGRTRRDAERLNGYPTYASRSDPARRRPAADGDAHAHAAGMCGFAERPRARTCPSPSLRPRGPRRRSVSSAVAVRPGPTGHRTPERHGASSRAGGGGTQLKCTTTTCPLALSRNERPSFRTPNETSSASADVRPSRSRGEGAQLHGFFFLYHDTTAESFFRIIYNKVPARQRPKLPDPTMSGFFPLREKNIKVTLIDRAKNRTHCVNIPYMFFL